MNVSLLEALSSVAHPSYKWLRNSIMIMKKATYLMCDANPVSDKYKCVSKMLAIMTPWNTVEADEVSPQGEDMLRAVWCLNSLCLNPVSCDGHEWVKIGIRPHIHCR